MYLSFSNYITVSYFSMHWKELLFKGFAIWRNIMLNLYTLVTRSPVASRRHIDFLQEEVSTLERYLGPRAVTACFTPDHGCRTWKLCVARTTAKVTAQASGTHTAAATREARASTSAFTPESTRRPNCPRDCPHMGPPAFLDGEW